jgi:ABC-type transporter lipoprotein component MlaA
MKMRSVRHLPRTVNLGKILHSRYYLPYIAALWCFLTPAGWAQTAASPPATTPPPPVSPGTPAEAIILPAQLPDPLEPFNRAMWSFNKGVLTYAVKPAAKGYRAVVAKPVRTGIGNIGKNIAYPVRLAGNLLEGNWRGVGDETTRCLCNTIFGLGGFFDVATRGGIPESHADIGEAFRKWGWQPHFFLMLPVFGPSDDPDATGLVGDALVNPMTYFYPYEYISPAIMANDISDSVDGAVRFSQTEPDPYSLLKYGWSFSHENRPIDWRHTGTNDEAALETLQAFFFNAKNPAFPNRGRTRSVLIPATGRKLEFTYWLQPHRAPIVYIVPGFGSHRLDANVLAFAELVYRHGCSAVTISSSFHPEFMEEASTSDMPSYPPLGVHDIHVALTAIDHRLEQDHPGRLGNRALLGYSMGGFQSLMLASQAVTNHEPLVHFARYVAIDPPVRLRYCVTNADNLYQSALAWPAAERTADIDNLAHKLVALVNHPPAPGTPLPLNATECRFLIGLSFRLTMRDLIWSSQFRHNQGILVQPLKESRRTAAYDEIMQYSFWDYLQKFLLPYNAARGIDLMDPQTMKLGTDLRSYSAGLEANHDIRVVANENDLFLAPPDLEWMRATVPSSQLTLFPHGGHLGNLAQPAVQQAILQALDGLE